MAQIEITQDYIIYEAESRLLQLATEIAQAKSLVRPDILIKIQLATRLRLWLEALDYNEFLTREKRERIWYALMDIANINDVPVTIPISNISAPQILVGIKGDKGDTGTQGPSGGGLAFSAVNVGTDTVVDSFNTSLSTASEWTYEVFDASNKRVERLIGGWLSGVATDDGGLATTDIGDTSGITFGVNISGSTVQLIAFVSSGIWTIRGTRLLIPVTGNGITQPTALVDGSIWIGDSSNQPAAQILSGDVTVTNGGITAISSGVISNADINTSAAIAVTKLAALTASKAVVSNPSGFLTTSTSDASKVDYLANVTSDIQTQINTIATAGSITGAITPYVTADAIVSRAIVSNPSGKLTTALTTSTEIGYVSGVTSSIQTQINTIAGSITGAITPYVAVDATASRAIISNPSGKLTTALTTSTEIGYVSGVTSSIQTQVNTKVNKAGDTMSGSLNMGGNILTNLPTAINPSDAVRFDQLLTASVVTTVVNIGDWNMDTTSVVAVNHGISDYKKIRSVFVIIRDDADTLYYPLDYMATSFNIDGGWNQISSSTIGLVRRTGGLFDSSLYVATSYNRGYMMITSIP